MTVKPMRANRLNILKEYVRELLEVKMMLGDEEYDVTDAVAKKIIKLINKEKDVPVVSQGYKPTSQEVAAYENLLESLAIIDPKISEKLKDVVDNTKVMGDELKTILSTKDPQKLSEALFTINETPVNERVRVPDVLRDVANLSTNTKAGGIQIGAGEIAIRLMFNETGTGSTDNSLYDVTINGEPWHVKAGSSNAGIKMGSARGKLLIDTELANELVARRFAKISDFTDMNQEVFSNLLIKWSNDYRTSGESNLDTPEKIYDVLNQQSIALSVGKAAGIVWYESGSLYFVTKDGISLQATTQGGRVIVSTNGKQKIMNLLSPEVAVSKKRKL